MNLLDTYLTTTGKQPADWKREDIDDFLTYVKAHATASVEPGSPRTAQSAVTSTERQA